MIIRTEVKSVVQFVSVEVMHDAVIYMCIVELFKNENKPLTVGAIAVVNKISKSNKKMVVNQIFEYFK